MSEGGGGLLCCIGFKLQRRIAAHDALSKTHIKKEEVLMKRSNFAVIVLSMAFILGVFLATPQLSHAAGCYIATIKGQDVGVEPMTLNIKVKDCVVFMNFSGSPTTPQEVKVLFKEGAKCMAAMEQIVGLSMDANKCLASGWIGYGQTPSAVFSKPGTYMYEIMYKAGGPSIKGTITVK